MAKYIRIERRGVPGPTKVYKVKGTILGFAAHDALRQLRRDDMHAFSYEMTGDKEGRLTAFGAEYDVRWATIKEWRAGGEA